MIKLEMTSKFATYEEYFEEFTDLQLKMKKFSNLFTNYSIIINGKVIVNNQEISDAI